MKTTFRWAGFAAAMLVSAAAWADCDDSHKASWAAAPAPKTAQAACEGTDCKPAPTERAKSAAKEEREGVRNGAKPAKAPAAKLPTTVALGEPAARR